MRAVLAAPAPAMRTETEPVTWKAATPYTPGDGAWYVWIEGNYACDCNRRLFMARALGEPEPDHETLKCGDTIVLEELRFDGVAQDIPHKGAQAK
jgi:hypothetical protein